MADNVSHDKFSLDIQVHDLSKTYPPIPKGLGILQIFRRAETAGTVALDHISFRIEGGEWFGLLGPNGAGKTTFCDILLDITHPTSGRILVDGIDVNKQHSKLKGMLCSVDYWSLDQRVKVRTFLERAGAEWMLPRKETRRRIDYLADLFEMGDKKDDWVIRLSGGMRKKLDLMATLMSGAPVLVLDEPTVVSTYSQDRASIPSSGSTSGISGLPSSGPRTTSLRPRRSVTE